jgi:hypothetical protein
MPPPKPILAAVSVGLAALGSVVAVLLALGSRGSEHAWIDMGPYLSSWFLVSTGVPSLIAGYWARRRKERYAWVGIPLGIVCILWAGERR